MCYCPCWALQTPAEIETLLHGLSTYALLPLLFLTACCALQAPAEAAAAYDNMLTERKAAAAAASSAAAGGGDAAAAGASGAEAAAVAAAGLPPGVKIAEAFELAQPGQKDGETKVVREGDSSIAAYGWDAAQCVWEKIGTVVDAPEPGG
jgi:hypothetical protein